MYDKDSLLNSNPSFDYGLFRQLAELATSGAAANVSTFGFTFTEAGIYVFYPLGSPALKTVVSVRRAGERCPTPGSINPLTGGTLVQVGDS